MNWVEQVQNQIDKVTDVKRLERMVLDLDRLLGQVDVARGSKEKKRISRSELKHLKSHVKSMIWVRTGKVQF